MLLPSMASVVVMAISPALCSGLQGSAVQPATLHIGSSRPIVDSVLFNGEQDMYALRVNELSPAVDVFMVFEGVCAFTGAPKNLTFDKSDARFGAASEKIVYREAPCFDANLTWDNERSMRRFILETIKSDMPSIAGPNWVDGAVMVSDVDEIPMAGKLQYLFGQPSLWIHLPTQVYRIRGQMYMYNVRCVETTRSAAGWKGTHILSGKMVNRDQAIDVVRARMRSNFSHEVVDEVDAPKQFQDLWGFGWHFSYFLSPEQIRNKIQTFSHQGYNTPAYTHLKYIRERQSRCIDPFDQTERFPTRKLTMEEGESQRLPEWLIQAAKDGRLPRQWLTGVYD